MYIFWAVVILMALLAAALWPLIFIWSLNVIFSLNIDYTFINWVASYVLLFTLRGAINVQYKKK